MSEMAKIYDWQAESQNSRDELIHCAVLQRNKSKKYIAGAIGGTLALSAIAVLVGEQITNVPMNELATVEHIPYVLPVVPGIILGTEGSRFRAEARELEQQAQELF